MDEYFYEVELYWKSGKTGVLNSHGLKEIEVLSPLKSPKEKKDKWTPEHLLAASVSACFMNTYLEIAELHELDLMVYHSQCFLKLENINGKYKATEILLRPIIKLTNSSSMLKAVQCVEEAEKISPIKNSIKMNVEVHPKFEYLHTYLKSKA
ncbi:MAG: hypothetical protein EAZ07_10150 [Cytophagales bacterium]|nr:MAG: hypothetical protein EAZ07_10150 [Cytophagales bacterium]